MITRAAGEEGNALCIASTIDRIAHLYLKIFFFLFFSLFLFFLIKKLENFSFSLITEFARESRRYC